MDDRELVRARWATFAALLIVFSSYSYFSFDQNAWIAGAIGLATSALLTAVFDFWLRLSLRRATGGERYRETRRKLENARQQVQAMLQLQHKVLDAHSEKDILEAVMGSGVLTLRATGASFVPYDEWGHSLPALFQGNVPEPALQSFASRLASPQTRQACKNCQALHGGAPGCALVPSELSVEVGVRCFPFFNAEREAGVFNFFFDSDDEIDPDMRVFMTEAIRAAELALQNLRLRDQEMAALRYLQTASAPKSELSLLLKSLLENVHNALDVDFALLYLPDGMPGQFAPAPLLLAQARAGDTSPSSIPDLPFLEGVWKSVLGLGQSISLENVTLNKRETWKALLAVPLIWQSEAPSGVLVLGSNSSQMFAQRHQALLETLASQAALLIQMPA